MGLGLLAKGLSCEVGRGQSPQCFLQGENHNKCPRFHHMGKLLRQLFGRGQSTTLIALALMSECVCVCVVDGCEVPLTQGNRSSYLLHFHGLAQSASGKD